ncbi:MAG: hypothetical protein WD512_14745, partial [Candidatus Paceibacterota bacterium]
MAEEPKESFDDQDDTNEKDNVDQKVKYEKVNRRDLTNHVKEFQEKLRKNLPYMLNDDNKNPKSKRVDLMINQKSNQYLAVIHGIMTKDECEKYIKESEAQQFSSISNEYPTDYRSSTRLVTFSDKFGQEIFNRLQKHYKDTD